MSLVLGAVCNSRHPRVLLQQLLLRDSLLGVLSFAANVVSRDLSRLSAGALSDLNLLLLVMSVARRAI